MLKSEQYYELDQDIIDRFMKIERKFAFALDIDYKFQLNTKLKQLVTVKKIPDNYAVMLNSNILVTFNEDFYNDMDDEIIDILVEQEIDKIVPNLEKGSIKLVQPSLKTTASMVKKHTYEKIERANEVQRLLTENKNDE